MNAFRILPLPQSIADQIREKRSDAHGNVELQPTRTEEPRALPCRVCLEEASVGEEMLLFSYSPFERPVPYRNVGPIFVHATACRPYDRPATVPDLMRRRLLALRGYSAQDRMIECDLVGTVRHRDRLNDRSSSGFSGTRTSPTVTLTTRVRVASYAGSSGTARLREGAKGGGYRPEAG